MTSVAKLETVVASWLKPVPHLPQVAQKWIAENVWWIVLIGVILSALSLLIGISGFFAALALFGSSVSYYGYAGSYYGGGWMISSLISLLFMVGLVVLLATAVTPLKSLKKKGWSILFLVLLLDAVYVVLNALLSFSVFGFIFGVIFGAIGLAISAYFIFEIRSYFVPASKAAHHVKSSEIK